MTTVASVFDAASPWLGAADGITVSGGEPFDQAEALAELLEALRGSSRGDILVFTGYPRETIRHHLDRAAGLIDALISDPFDRSMPQSLALRGSDNQRLHLLTALGRERFAAYDRPAAAADRTVDVMFDAAGDVWFAGIPARDDFRKLKELLEAGGHRLSTSEHARAGGSRPTDAPR